MIMTFDDVIGVGDVVEGEGLVHGGAAHIIAHPLAIVLVAIRGHHQRRLDHADTDTLQARTPSTMVWYGMVYNRSYIHNKAKKEEGRGMREEEEEEESHMTHGANVTLE